MADLALADDQPGEPRRIDASGRPLVHHAAGAHDHQLIGDLEHLEQLVADQHDRSARSGDAPDDREQAPVSSGERTEVGSSRIRTRAPTASVRSSSSCWRSASSSARPARRDRSRSRPRPSARGSGHRPVGWSRRPRCSPSEMFSKAVSVSTSLNCWWTIPIPAATEARGEPSGSGPLDQNAAALRQVQAGQHVHRRGLAGAVLAEQTDDPAGGNVEADVVVGEQRPETFGHALQADQRRLALACPASRPPARLAVAPRGAQGILPTTPSTSQFMPLMSAMLKVLPAATTSLP